MTRNALLLPALMALIFAGTLSAQFSSNVQGAVSDPSGGVIPGATVVLRNSQTGVENTTATDNAGFYRFTSVVAGSYRVVVGAKGFQRTELPFELGPQETQAVNVALNLGGSAVEVTVTEKTPGVNIDETRLVTTISGQQFTDLPLAQRGSLNVVKLAPGAVSTNPSESFTNIAIGPQQPSVVANGRPASANLYRLDGIPIMSVGSYGNINIIPTPDMIQETALQTATFSTETGGTSSLVTDFTSKSGTNRFHGDIDGTYSSRYFQQHTWGSGSGTPFTQKWLSGSLGGAILKNRTYSSSAPRRASLCRTALAAARDAMSRMNLRTGRCRRSPTPVSYTPTL